MMVRGCNYTVVGTFAEGTVNEIKSVIEKQQQSVPPERCLDHLSQVLKMTAFARYFESWYPFAIATPIAKTTNAQDWVRYTRYGNQVASVSDPEYRCFDCCYL